MFFEFTLKKRFSGLKMYHSDIRKSVIAKISLWSNRAYIWVSLWNFFSAPSVSRGSTYLRKTQNISKKWFLEGFFNLKNSSKTCFSWIHTCFDEDIEAYECAIDMVDGALETLDLTLSKRGIVGFTFGFFVDDSDSFSFFSPFFFWIFLNFLNVSQ